MSEHEKGDDEVLDPRIEVELENLNSCSEDINKLEKQLEVTNVSFHEAFAKYSHQLKILNKKIGKKCIDKARPFYTAKEIVAQSQKDAQKAAIEYQRSVTAHESAKDAFRTAEQKLLDKTQELEFNPAQQEMLNQITLKVAETETHKAHCEKEHRKRTLMVGNVTKKSQYLERELKSTITKSRHYFGLKEEYLRDLEDLKQRIQHLQQAIQLAKRNYADSLRNLEMISEEIHTWRLLRQPREPGVGAEKETLSEEMMDHVDGLMKDFKLH